MGRRATAENNLSVLYPQISSEWHPEKNLAHLPNQFLPKSNKKFWWLCSACSHEWYLAICDRHGYGCPSCAGKVVHSDGHNSLAKLNPSIASEWHEDKNANLTPEMLLPSSGKMAYWRCNECQHVWKTKPNQRCDSNGKAKYGGGCPCCAGQAVNSENAFNSLENMVPWILKEWDYDSNEFLPTEILPRSHRPVKWVCKSCDDKWVAKPGDRVNADFSPRNGCPTCANQKVHTDGWNSLANKYPEIAVEWHPSKNDRIKPSDIVSGSHTNFWWKCSECNHDWRISPGARTQGLQTGCPACANLTIKPDKSNSLGVFAPWTKKEWHYERNGQITPETVVFGARKRVWWKCSMCDFEYQAMICARIDSNDGSKISKCSVCANRIVHPDGRNSLALMRPEIASEWHESNPDTPSDLPFGSNKVRKWKCAKGHVWDAQLNTRLRSGCKSCAKYGFNPTYPASVYVLKIIKNAEETFYKAGITNQLAKKRMAQISRSVRKFYPNSTVEMLTDFRLTFGEYAKDIEDAIMAGENRYEPTEMFDGYTECFSTNPTSMIESIIDSRCLSKHIID